MDIQVKSVNWNRHSSIKDLVDEAQSQGADYLIAQSSPNPAITVSMNACTVLTDLVVFRDSSDTRRWIRLGKSLPAFLYFLAVPPTDHQAIAISIQTLTANSNKFINTRSLAELVVRLSESTITSFVDNLKNNSISTFQYPALTKQARPGEPPIREIIQHLSEVIEYPSSIALTALKAGLYLLNNFIDESHSASQSIEGMGSFHTGDYWHAILHRREPDYGNAKYWFRHVGQHPIFSELAKTVNQRLDETEGTLKTKLHKWKPRLAKDGVWNPVAFVDLCSAAEGDTELRTWCEHVQYDEMLLLLETSSRDVIDPPNKK